MAFFLKRRQNCKKPGKTPKKNETVKPRPECVSACRRAACVRAACVREYAEKRKTERERRRRTESV